MTIFQRKYLRVSKPIPSNHPVTCEKDGALAVYAITIPLLGLELKIEKETGFWILHACSPGLNILRRMTIKLNLLFIVMDMLTLLAYPIVFVHGKLRQFSRSSERIDLVNLLVTGSVTPGK